MTYKLRKKPPFWHLTFKHDIYLENTDHINNHNKIMIRMIIMKMYEWKVKCFKQWNNQITKSYFRFISTLSRSICFFRDSWDLLSTVNFTLVQHLREFLFEQKKSHKTNRITMYILKNNCQYTLQLKLGHFRSP